jgi:N-acetylneuraminic acid mutarotase
MKGYCLILIGFLSFGAIGQTENVWTPKNDFLGGKRERAVAFAIGNYGYIGTGMDTLEVTLSDFWRYNPSTDTWSQVADLPASPRRNAIAFVVENFAYVGTGMTVAEASELGAQALNDFWQYNPVTNSWVQKANYPGSSGFGIYFGTAFSIDSKGYVCGGKVGPNSYSNQLWEYKPSIDQWTQLSNFPGGVRYQLSSFSIGYKAYIGLGADQDMYRNDMWEFDATTNQWNAKANLPASERGSATTFTIGQRGFIATGVNGGILDDLWEYNPFNDTWSSKATYGGSARKNAVAFVVNDKAYMGTGKGYTGKKSSMHEYSPSAILGTDEAQIDISIYPNPASEILYLNFEHSAIDALEIYSITGELIVQSEAINVLNIASLSPGNYIIIGRKNALVVSTQSLIIQ